MKGLHYVAFCAAALLSISCDNNPTSTTSTSDSFSGTWELQYIEEPSLKYVNGNLVSSSSQTHFPGTSENQNTTDFTFFDIANNIIMIYSISKLTDSCYWTESFVYAIRQDTLIDNSFYSVNKLDSDGYLSPTLPIFMRQNYVPEIKVD
mgnify:CR=1 FL=1